MPHHLVRFFLLLVVMDSVDIVESTLPSRRFIHRGTNSSPGEFPFMAIVSSGDYTCGGVLYRREVVITAKHCTEMDNGVRFNTNEITVKLGKHNRNSDEAGELTLGVTDIVRHPEVDLALLFLERAVEPTSSIKSIAHFATSRPAAGTQVTAAGWGLTESGRSAPTLQKVTLPVQSNQECMRQEAGLAVQPTAICAGFTAGTRRYTNVCYGDSGGPLVMKDEHNQWILVGITSGGNIGHGPNNCSPNYSFALYLSIPEQASWIQRSVDDPVNPFQCPIVYFNQKCFPDENGRRSTVLCPGIQASQYCVNLVRRGDVKCVPCCKQQNAPRRGNTVFKHCDAV